jgi:hypothetical protein
MKLELVNFLDQDFEDIKQNALDTGNLFVDDRFPPNSFSISLVKTATKPYKIVWKRPHQIVPNPRFILKEVSTNGICQGDTGNCWFIASVVSLIGTKGSILDFVIPQNQSFDKKDYAGVFHFRFWMFGVWVNMKI